MNVKGVRCYFQNRPVKLSHMYLAHSPIPRWLVTEVPVEDSKAAEIIAKPLNGKILGFGLSPVRKLSWTLSWPTNKLPLHYSSLQSITTIKLCWLISREHCHCEQICYDIWRLYIVKALKKLFFNLYFDDLYIQMYSVKVFVLFRNDKVISLSTKTEAKLKEKKITMSTEKRNTWKDSVTSCLVFFLKEFIHHHHTSDT